MYTKKLYFDAKNHRPFSDLRCDQYPLRREPKRAWNGDFWHVFACDVTGIDSNTNRRTGGDFWPRNTTFLYTSLSCVINIQILNCAGSLDGVSWWTVARTAGEPWSTLIGVTLTFFIIQVESGYLVMTGAYQRPFLSPLSLSFLLFLLQTCF